jgi:tRNA(Ile)-lysidine synthase
MLSELPHSTTVLVACSGGTDSLALAAATAFEAPKLKLRAGAVIVDHGLQADSAHVAEAAAEQCRGLGLDPVLVRPVEVGSEGGPVRPVRRTPRRGRRVRGGRRTAGAYSRRPG